MFSRSLRGLKGWLAGTSAALLLAGGLPQARADEKDDLRALKERLEALEKKNEALMLMLESAQPVAQDRAGAVAPPAPSDAASRETKKIIDDYLKEKDEKAKKEAEAKKKEAEEKGFVVGDNLGLTVKWDHGLWAESADKAFRVHVGGRTQMDAVWYNVGDNVMFGNNGVGSVDDAVAFRRARLAIEGTLWEVINFNMEYDFANTTRAVTNVDFDAEARTERVFTVPVPTDLWVEATHLPYVGNVRIGNQKAPISFEHMTSSRFLNFMERSYGFDAYVGGPDNGFDPGVVLYNNYFHDRLHLAAGLLKFNQTVFGFNTGDGDWQAVARAGVFPIWEDDGRLALWVGCGYRHNDADFIAQAPRQFAPESRGSIRLRARTLLRNGPAELHTLLVDTTPFADDQDLIVPEMALVAGPWTVTAEYFGSWVHGLRNDANGPSLGTQYTQSAYVEVLYFLSGEHRQIDRKYPRYNRVVPHENFFCVHDDECRSLFGRGAWQVGMRYSWIDLDDNIPITAGSGTFGSAQGLTLGLNWFLNPNMKLQWNYTYEQRYNINRVAADASNAGLFPALDSDGALRGFGMRMAIDF